MRTVVNCQTGEITQVELTAEEIAANAPSAESLLKDLRLERSRLLAETDYLALADSTLTDEMRDYRQALRDLPANTVDPANPVWPVKPGA